MTESIRRQLVVPPHVSAIYLAVGLTLLAAGIALVAVSSTPTPTPAVPRLELTAPAPEPAPPRVAMAAPETQPIADTIQLLFRAGGATYMRLTDLERDGDGARHWPRHTAPRLLTEEGVSTALATVRDSDVPAIHRAWAGKQVVVDGACRATVSGFAIASRLVGSPAYAGIEKEDWDAASVMYLGTPVLAAKLDACQGTYARDAALPPVVVPTEIKDARLARTARSALIASPAGADAERRWTDMPEQVPPGAWYETTEFTTKIVRHPRTGVTFVAVHGHIEYGCGGPDVNVWGLYRAAADGTLTPVREARLETLHSIDQIIDIEGDGELELIGRSWLGTDVIVADAAGTPVDTLGMQFYGCPC